MIACKLLVLVIALLSGLAGVTPTSATPIPINFAVTINFDPSASFCGDGCVLRANAEIVAPPNTVVAETSNAVEVSPASAGHDYMDNKDRIDSSVLQELYLRIDALMCRLILQNPCGETLPAYAFPEGTRTVDLLPNGPPLIPIGTLNALSSSTTVFGPIFAFASPGTQVGTWELQITVPEPTTLALLGLGLAGLAASRRRRQ